MENKEIEFLIKSYKSIFKELIKSQIDITHEQICSRISYENSLNIEVLTRIEELKDIYDIYFKQSFLSALVINDDLFEVIIHGNKSIEYIFSKDKLIDKGLNLTLEDLEICLSVLALKNKQNWNFQNPFCSFLLSLNSEDYRCSITHSSISANNMPSVFLRKIGSKIFTIDSYGENANIVKDLVTSKKNIIIAGSTGSGKTSFLKSSIAEIDNKEHVIVIEDTHEISFNDKNFTNLLASEGKNKSMTDFCKYALRMSPERIILGEIRSHEVIPFVLAMNTGHSGLMATIHANSAQDTLTRLAMLFSIFSNASQSISFEQILKLICKNIDYVIFLEDKKVTEIVEVKGAEGMNPIIVNSLEKQAHSNQQLETLLFAC